MVGMDKIANDVLPTETSCTILSPIELNRLGKQIFSSGIFKPRRLFILFPQTSTSPLSDLHGKLDLILDLF